MLAAGRVSTSPDARTAAPAVSAAGERRFAARLATRLGLRVHRRDGIEHGGELGRKRRAHVERHAEPGQSKATDCACRNIRLRPMALELGVALAIAVLVVPSNGCPAKAACTRI